MTKEKNKTNDGKATQKVASEKSETKTKGNTAKDEAPSVASSDKASAETVASNESSGAADTARKNYVRGESQKPVTKAYRDNWNKIFQKR